MTMMRNVTTKKWLALALMAFVSAAAPAYGQLIAFEDFDGGAMNLTSGFVPATDNIDGGGGDFYGVGSLGAWPSPDGTPFSVADDSVIGVSDNSRDPANAFAGDTEGVFGQAADVDNNFFTIADVRDEAPLVANWLFDISSATTPVLQLSIDMGQQSDGDAFGGITAADLVFDYSLDGGATFQTAFDLDTVDSTDTGFAYRALDVGTVPTAASVLAVTNLDAQKFEADTGLLAGNLFLNKTPASGTGAGLLDTFTTNVNALGATSLQLRLTTTTLSFEAFSFDNISISSGAAVPEPGSAALLAIASLGFVARRRRS